MYYRVFASVPLADLLAAGRDWYRMYRELPTAFVGTTLSAVATHQARGNIIVLIFGSFQACLESLATEIFANRVSGAVSWSCCMSAARGWISACVRTPSPSGKRSRRQEIRIFATTTNALLELRDWLLAEKVTLVVMEATGDYWSYRSFWASDRVLTPVEPASHSRLGMSALNAP